MMGTIVFPSCVCATCRSGTASLCEVSLAVIAVASTDGVFTGGGEDSVRTG